MDAIIGLDEAKNALYEACLMRRLVHPACFVGVRTVPSTILLCGPPGTGKTLLVQAAAAASGAKLLGAWVWEEQPRSPDNHTAGRPRRGTQPAQPASQTYPIGPRAPPPPHTHTHMYAHPLRGCTRKRVVKVHRRVRGKPCSTIC